MIRLRRRTSSPPSGFTVFEVVISMILLGSVIAMVIPVTKRALDQRERAEARRAALLEVSNALERVVADAAERPARGTERELPLPDEFKRQFREPRLTVASVEFDGPPAGLRFDAAFTSQDVNGRETSPVRLSAFAFDTRAEGETP